ncbi:unnamed protein product [Pocillopora meandrina]|uniref:TRAF-type domain-containing protein n=1 Tax=Pocillopora meandrina TaxID=46732 RepID=A0AAU9Y7A3_9CNID|nr:unnamed protein product [Pocillopora meandrina]
MSNCACGARVRRVDMHRHRTQLCPCLPASCPLTCGLELGRKDVPFHMVICPKRIVQCGVPGCLDVIRQSEMVVHIRDNARKHLGLYAIDEQAKVWSLKEATVYTEIKSKSAVVLTWLVPNDWKWPIASPLVQAFDREWRLVLTRGKL